MKSKEKKIFFEDKLHIRAWKYQNLEDKSAVLRKEDKNMFLGCVFF